MSNGKSTWKYNKLLTARRNYFSPGGNLGLNLDFKMPDFEYTPPTNAGGNNGGGNKGSGFLNGIKSFLTSETGKSTLVGAAGKVGESLISDGYTSDTGDYLSKAGDLAQYLPGLYGIIGSAALKGAAGLYNRFHGIKLNDANIANVENNINQLNSFQTSASSFDTLAAQASNAPAALGFADSYIGEDAKYRSALTDNTVANKANELRKRQSDAEQRVLNGINNNADAIRTASMATLLANEASFGGELNTQGGDFTNGLLHINNGGTHERNPYEGVLMGVDYQGVPNLVEEGETIFKDYVFSNRLEVPKKMRQKYKLGGKKLISFADASKALAKESEERPNDIISINGLNAFMSDLRTSQEQVRALKGENNMYATGGRVNKFDTAGEMEKVKRANQTLNMNNRTPGLNFGVSSFNPYNSDGTINFNALYADDSPYMKRRQYIIDHWEDEAIQEWKKRYIDNINRYNADRSGYVPMKYGDIDLNTFKTRTMDGNLGEMHMLEAFIDTDTPNRSVITQHKLRGKDTLSDMPESDVYFSDIDEGTGKTWEELFSDKYTMANNGTYHENYNPETNTVTRTYYYDPVTKKSKNRYYIKGENGYEQVTGNNPYLDIANKGNYVQTTASDNEDGGRDYYYDPKQPSPKYDPLPTSMRYAPVVAKGIQGITDLFGITNKPDYAYADELASVADKVSSTVSPVRFTPIGTRMKYTPYDINHGINALNSTAGATRRNIMNTASGNTGVARASMLAADYNTMNAIGNLGIEAAKYNADRRKEVAEFNRGTDMANSEGFLKADMANQSAMSGIMDLRYKSAIAAAEAREKARRTSEAMKSGNLSGIFTDLGNIGKENMAWNWRNFGMASGVYGNIPEEYKPLLEGENNTYSSNNRAKGGKIKKRKGLTR